MGTSVSHPSPPTSSWRAANAAYISADISVKRAVQLIWRAEGAQPERNLSSDLALPIIAKCFQIAGTCDREQAYHAVTREISMSRSSTLAVDMARRAVLYASGTQQQDYSFVLSLMTQATDYLISRDASGYIGKQSRFENVGALISFKRSVQERVASFIKREFIPNSTAITFDKWREYILQIVDELIINNE